MGHAGGGGGVKGMATCEGEIVYQLGDKNEGSDVHDDTALVKAYEKAVQSCKDSLRSNESSDNQEEHEEGESKPKEKTEKEKKASSEVLSEGLREWKVGDSCRAMWSEDGFVYAATVQSINESKQTCVVMFEGYGNEDELSLADLLPPSDAVDRNGQERAQEKAGKTRAASSQEQEQATKKQSKSSKKSSNHWSNWPWPVPPPSPGPLPHVPAYNSTQDYPWYGMPPPHLQGHPPLVPSWPPVIPPFPPPPPPVTPEFDDDADSTLVCMLLAWYMSGYHTGYYMGLKHGQAKATGSSQKKHPKRK
uniref:Tudor domain-containing protein n=1 Tax=Latimeria chalumnae TaxID=7897 RepID=H3ANC5_LATCH